MDLPSLVLCVLAALFAIRCLLSRRWNEFEKLAIPHTRPLLPGLGNMAPAVFRMCPIAEAVDRVYRLNDDAKYVGFYDFGAPTIIIRCLDLIKDITIKRFDHFVDHRGFVDADREPLFGNNLFSLRGEKWREMRNLLTPAFTSSKMRAMFELMSNCGEKFADYAVERATAATAGSYVVGSKDAFTRYTNDVIASCAFGISVDSMRNPKNDFYVLGRKALDFEGVLSLKFFILRSFPRISRLLGVKLIGDEVERFFERVVRETVETRDREGITRPDMLQLMMESRRRNDESAGLGITEMTSQAFVFFLGGFDTTAALMCFVAHEIAVNPEIQEKLRNEIDRVLQGQTNGVSYDAINQMRYLDAVINEALRLYPIGIFLDRQCVKTYELPPALPGGRPVTLRPGDNVWIPVYSLQRDPKYFTDPRTFDPERFTKNGENSRADPTAYVPFGLGPRMCIGNRFALLETKVVMFHLLSKCRLKPARRMRLPLELSASSFAMTAKGGFWLEIEARNDDAATSAIARGSPAATPDTRFEP